MSNKLLAIAWKADIPSGKKIILLALCDEADDNGRTNPSVDYLGKKGGLMGRSTVFNHLKDLEIEGFIKRFSTSGKNTIYQIDINKINSTPVQESNPSRMWTSPENGQPVQILDYTRPESEAHPSKNQTRPECGRVQKMDNPSKYWTIPVQNQNHSCPESEQHPSKKWTGLGGKGEILKKEKDLNNFSFLKSNPSDSWTGQATELPQNFMADEGNINLAKQKGINLELSLPKFKAHHKTKRTFSHDWQAQLEYWLLNAPSPVIQYKEGNSSEDLSEEEKLKKKFTFLSRSLGKDINVQVTNFLREVNFDEIPQHERDSCFQRYLMGQK